MHDPLPSEESALTAFIAAFEDGTLPKARWTHAAHIFTGACYVHALGEPAAIDRMRTRVSAYNLAVGGQNTPTSGYHETVTVLWIKLLSQFRREHPTLARVPFATFCVEHFAPQRDLLRRYYDYDVVASPEARRAWHPPTLQSLDS
ncbi:MAG: hypothetical protein JWM43_2271 [Acidobacteriaceae bacterium]|nr:hypothetical protein [Acidobacteriaceae bacterium]